MTGGPGAGPGAGRGSGAVAPGGTKVGPHPARPAGGADTPRGRLLRAAREVVAADGLEGLTLRAIARRAGVSHGAPLRHFPTLAALLAAVAADGFTRLVSTISGAIAAAERAAADAGRVLGPRERLAVAGRAYVAFALAEPGIYGVMFRPDRVDVTDTTYRAQGAASFGQLVALVEDAQAAGWQPGEPPEALAAVLWANVHGVADLTLHGAMPAVVGEAAPDLVPRLFDRLALDVEAPEAAVAPDRPNAPDAPDAASDRHPLSRHPPTTGGTP